MRRPYREAVYGDSKWPMTAIEIMGRVAELDARRRMVGESATETRAPSARLVGAPYGFTGGARALRRAQSRSQWAHAGRA